MEAQEQQIIQQAQNGSAAAFAALVNQHARYVYNLALRIVQNPQEAEDLSQEVFIRVWKALPGFRAGSAFRTWLYRIVVNLCYDRLPRLRKEMNAMDDTMMEDLPGSYTAPEANLLNRETQSALQNAFTGLPQKYRLLLSLRHLQEMSYDEIAEITNMPLGTVKTGIFRGRQLLKEAIKEREYGME